MKRPVAVTAGLAILLAVAFTGYFTGRSSRQPLPATESSGTAAPQRVYTCSMHPQVRLAQPGNCPICEMPLIPAGGAPSAGDDVPALTLSEQALAMASVETTPVAYREMSRALRAVGKVAYHEPSLATITARVDGYAERLFVNVTGVDVQAGDHLVEIYSPDLLVAQQELLIALRGGTNSPLVASARIKLRNLGLTTGQIEELATSQTPAERVTLQTPSAGTVIEKTIVENSAFKAGDVLYRIANLEQVWVYLEIYEFDLAWVRDGQAVEITTEAYPGRLFTGTVAFVEPVLNERTRTVRVPVLVANEGRDLKPGMYASAVIRAVLVPDSRAVPVHAAAAYICPMRCEGERVYDKPGRCPVCNMHLEKVSPPEQAASDGRKGLLAVPVTAVLDSGTRRLVYVERSRGTFEPREVTLGPRGDDYYPVLKGLEEGERVVTRGGFLVDSQFQITGHPSLYYPGGLHADPAAPDDAGAAPAPAADDCCH